MFRDTKTFFSYSVKDLQRAKRVLTPNLLGLDVRETPEGLWLQLAGGGSAFLYPKPNHEPATFTVLNFKVDDVEKAVDALAAKGIRFEQYDLPQPRDRREGNRARQRPHHRLVQGPRRQHPLRRPAAHPAWRPTPSDAPSCTPPSAASR